MKKKKNHLEQIKEVKSKTDAEKYVCHAHTGSKT